MEDTLSQVERQATAAQDGWAEYNPPTADAFAQSWFPLKGVPGKRNEQARLRVAELTIYDSTKPVPPDRGMDIRVIKDSKIPSVVFTILMAAIGIATYIYFRGGM